MLKEELLCNPREENGLVVYEEPWIISLSDYWKVYLECSCISEFKDGDFENDEDILRIVARSVDYDSDDKIRKYYTDNFDKDKYTFVVGMQVNNVLGVLI